MFAVAAIAIACGGTTTPGSDAATDAPADAREDDSASLPFYGAAPFDSGQDANDAAPDVDEGGVALYGAPPPPDSG